MVNLLSERISGGGERKLINLRAPSQASSDLLPASSDGGFCGEDIVSGLGLGVGDFRPTSLEG